jgi:YidC/Oxa1 family membrane protein insertase
LKNGGKNPLANNFSFILEGQMDFINSLFGYPLGFVMWAIYKLVQNYGVAIVLFTLVTKILIFPLSVKQQKNMARMSLFQPKMAELQKKYGKNKEKLQEEQMKLYAEEGVNPMGSCLPLLIQFPILFGIVDVIYKPMTHIMHFSSGIISQAADIAKKVFEASGKIPQNFAGYQQQLYIMQAYSKDPSAFESIKGFSEQAGNFDMKIFGGAIDLGAVPTLTWPMLLIPVLAGISQLALTLYGQWYQKKTNPSAAQTMGAMNAMLYIMPVFSVWMAFALPAGAGFYWIMQSVFSFAQSIVLNKIYTPEKMQEIVKKEQEKKKRKGPTYMQRVLEQQKAMLEQQQGNRPQRQVKVDDDGEIKLSKSAQKDMTSKIIAEARRRYAEKYGDDIDESDTE